MDIRSEIEGTTETSSERGETSINQIKKIIQRIKTDPFTNRIVHDIIISETDVDKKNSKIIWCYAESNSVPKT